MAEIPDVTVRYFYKLRNNEPRILYRETTDHSTGRIERTEWRQFAVPNASPRQWIRSDDLTLAIISGDLDVEETIVEFAREQFPEAFQALDAANG